MELFSDCSNSPRHLSDLFNLQFAAKQMVGDTLDFRTVGASFFEDPQWAKGDLAEVGREDFILDINRNEDKDLQNYQVFDTGKKIKKSNKKKDEKKNICGYITKRIMRELLREKYKGVLWKMCVEYKCKKNVLRQYLLSKIQSMIGPLHLQNLLSPSSDPVEMSCKKVFLKFFEWFLKERYIRYLANDGKMGNKKLYIDYKNITIARIIRRVKGKYEEEAQ